MFIYTCMFIALWVSKKIFPTPGGYIYMCVDIYARGLMHVWPGRYCVIRVPEFSIRAGIFRHCMCCLTLICVPEFLIRAGIFEHCIWHRLSHSATMPNFLRSNAYRVLPFTTFTFVSRPSAIIAFTSPFHSLFITVIVWTALGMLFSGDLYVFICSCGTHRTFFLAIS